MEETKSHLGKVVVLLLLGVREPAIKKRNTCCMDGGGRGAVYIHETREVNFRERITSLVPCAPRVAHYLAARTYFQAAMEFARGDRGALNPNGKLAARRGIEIAGQQRADMDGHSFPNI